jgi:hypothetical protein
MEIHILAFARTWGGAAQRVCIENYIMLPTYGRLPTVHAFATFESHIFVFSPALPVHGGQCIA